MASQNDPNRLITLAIHTYEQAVQLKGQLEQAGVTAVLHNVNLSEPVVSAGVRVRIQEKDLPKALKVVESPESTCSAPKSPTPQVKVLIPVDFSGYSTKTCQLGFEYAHRFKGSVVLLHAYMNAERRFFLPFGSDKFDSGQKKDDNIQAEALLHMKEFRSKLEKDMVEGKLANVSFETAVREGIPEQCILECAEEVKASLIVMGSAGSGQRQRAALGSVTAEVLDACKFPIVIIPKNVGIDRLAAVKNVVFFSNLIPQDILSFDLFSELISVEDMNVNVIPVVEKKDSMVLQSKQQLIQYFEDHYPKSKFTMTDVALKGELEEFQKFVDENHIDLIAIPNKKTNIFSRLFNPSIAHRVLFQSDTPMVVVPV